MAQREFRQIIEELANALTDSGDNCSSIEIPPELSGPEYIHQVPGCALCVPMFSANYERDRMRVYMPDAVVSESPEENSALAKRLSEALQIEDLTVRSFP